MIMLRLNHSPEKHGDIFQVINHYHGEIVDLHDNRITIAFNGTPDRIETILSLLEHFGIIDVVRSGIAVMKKHENNNFTNDSATRE